MTKQKTYLHHLRTYIVILLGALVYSLGVVVFLSPFEINGGGIVGLATILADFLPFSSGTILIALNIPIFIMGWIRFRDRYILRTFVSIALVSFFLTELEVLLNPYLPMNIDLTLSSIAGGALIAIGIALIQFVGGSTGGTDIIIKLLRQKFTHIRSGLFLFIIDFFFILISVIAYHKIELALYGLICLIVQGVLLDKLLYGFDEAKLVYVISDYPNEIAEILMQHLELGVTLLSGKGAYSDKEREIILCAFHKQSYSQVRNEIKKVDPNAFLIVTSATEIFGEGFKDHFADEL